MTSVAVLEHVVIVTPLGVQLRDEATRSDVSDGLTATVYPPDQPERRSDGFPNPSGIFAFHNIPDGRFVLEVRDRFGRYLPYRRAIDVPQHGVQTFPLFSSVARAIPGGMTAFRAELRDAAGGPAAWALVEATAGEQRVMTGLSDERGRVLVPLLYPKPVITLGSPATPKTPLTSQSWAVDVTIRYSRREPIPTIPDLADILSQPPATAFLPTSPATPWNRGTLRFGRELVPETGGGEAMPVLLIQPAVSPP